MGLFPRRCLGPRGPSGVRAMVMPWVMAFSIVMEEDTALLLLEPSMFSPLKERKTWAIMRPSWCGDTKDATR